ncbi:MAG: sce7725 family protein [Alteromonadaceae bacterium]|nr:sce7725 family protein [Alteromonadaceae bacterium]
MYYPYFRGKQNELILLRENSELISKSDIVPIIEPVKSNINPINKSLTSLIASNANFIVIINPRYGDFSHSNEELREGVFTEEMLRYKNLIIGYICDENTELAHLTSFLDDYQNQNIALIHYGYSNGKALSESIAPFNNVKVHVFIEEHAQKRYRRNFNNGIERVLIRDGFRKRSNREHPFKEHFSELHIMFEEEGMQGFGDFLINGDDYSESGGPAYAIAIHLTFLEPEDDDDMYIKHYVSDRNNSPADPGGKFLEALYKLVVDLDKDKKMFHSNAVNEFKALKNRDHYPGLGSIKKLSMQHHIELLANFFKG